VNTLFSLASLPVLPIWLLMILAPRWTFTRRLLASPWVAALPAALYAALVLPRLGDILPAVVWPSLDGIQTLLGTPAGATIAWVHFLAFDLLIGRWIYLDAQERHLSPLLTGPILFFTLLLGPLGFLSYLLLRLMGRPATVEQAA
jgi:Domain of unknown function (DUF4281)